MNRLRRLSWNAVFGVAAMAVLAMLVGCSSASTPDVSGSSEGGPESAVRGRGREVSWNTGVLEDLGHSLTIVFTGGQKGNLELDPCVSEYDVEVEETAEAVVVTLYSLELVDPPDLPDNFGCDAIGYERRFGVTVGGDGLGDRDAIDGATGEVRAIIDQSGILLPTSLPDGWSEWSRHPDGPGLTISYGPVGEDGFPPLMYLVVPTDNGYYNMDRDNLKADLTSLEEIGVRGNESGAFVVTSLEDGARSIVFEHGGRFHRVTIQADVDRSVALEFVESLG